MIQAGRIDRWRLLRQIRQLCGRLCQESCGLRLDRCRLWLSRVGKGFGSGHLVHQQVRPILPASSIAGDDRYSISADRSAQRHP